MDFEIIKIGHEHLDAILRVQQSAYSTQFHEDIKTFASKIDYSPKTCYGVLVENKLVAYAISFPWSSDEIVNLNSTLNLNFQKPTVMYIHDISVDLDYQGLGLATTLLRKITHTALELDLHMLTLVAVQGSSTYWSKFGFVKSELKVNNYGLEAVKMTLTLDSNYIV